MHAFRIKQENLNFLVFLIFLVGILCCFVYFNVELILFLSLFILLCIPISYSIIKKKDLLSPLNLFCFLYMLSFFITPILNHLRLIADDPAYVRYDKVYELKTQALSIAGLVFLYFGYIEGFIFSKITSPSLTLKTRVNYHKAKILVIFIFLISLFSFLYLANNFNIKVKDFTEYFIYTNVASLGRGHVAFLCYSYIFAFFICIISIFDRKKRDGFFILFIALSFLLAILTRSRGHVVMLIFIYLIFYNFKVKKVNLPRLMKVFIILLFIIFFIGQFRGARNFQLSKENISNTFGGLFTEFQATAALISQYEKNGYEYYKGRILFEDIFLSLIPRAIFPSKPNIYGGIVVTDKIIPNRQPGFYYSTGIFGSSYADFGYLGVFIMMFLFGLFMKLWYNFVIKNKENAFVILIHAVFSFSLWAFLRGGPGAIPSLLQFLIPAISIYFIISEKETRKKYFKNCSFENDKV